MSDLMSMPIRQLISEMREQLKGNNNIITVLLIGTLINRMEDQEDALDIAKQQIQNQKKID